MIWKKLCIETSVEAIDLLSEFLNDNGAEGVLIEDNVALTDDELIEMFVDVPLPISEDDGTAKVSCFLKSEDEVRRISALMEDELRRLSEFLPVGTGSMSVEDTTDDTTWNDNWKQYYKPFRLYDDIVIEPAWEEFEDKKADDKVIKIESVMAFGTGTHETTKLCLGMLNKYISNNGSLIDKAVFDIGCGSGILSIAAVLMGAGYVHGLDIDPQAVESSRINAAANGLSSDRIDFSAGNLLAKNFIPEKYARSSVASGISSPISAAEMIDLSLGGEDSIPAREYDIVVANILADVIIPLSGVVSDYLKKGGYFITSGITEDREDDVKEALILNGFSIVETSQMNEWVSIVCTK